MSHADSMMGGCAEQSWKILYRVLGSLAIAVAVFSFVSIGLSGRKMKDKLEGILATTYLIITGAMILGALPKLDDG